MEILFACAGCLGAFALGLLADRLCAGGGAKPPAQEREEDLPPAVMRQWQDFLRYDGRGEGNGHDEH